jgi:hypothetical protein
LYPLDPEQWTALLGRFSDGIAIVRVVCRSLAHQDIASEELATFDTAVAALDGAYNDLDVAVVPSLMRVSE